MLSIISDSQCRGTKKNGDRCTIKRDLNDDHLCKYHKIPTEYCRRIKTNGTQCEIHWDLDPISKLCETHKHQAPRSNHPNAPVPSPSNVVPTTGKPQSRGTNKQGLRCGFDWELNGDNMCKYHVRQIPQCHGELDDGRRCKERRSIDTRGFCVDHRPSPNHTQTSSVATVESDAEKAQTSEDDSTSEPGDSTTTVRTGCMALVFGDVLSWLRNSQAAQGIEWEIRDTSNNVLTDGTSPPNVVHLLPMVDSTQLDSYTLTITVQFTHKKSKTMSHQLTELRNSTSINIGDHCKLRVQILPVATA